MLDLLEEVDELGPRLVALQVGDFSGAHGEALGVHEGVELAHRLLELADDDGRRIHEPDLLGPLCLLAREEGDGLVDLLVLGPEVEDVARGLRAVEDAVRPREGLDETVMPESLVYVEGVEVLGVEAREEHVDDDDEVHLLLAAEVLDGVLLVLDALLEVLVVEVEVVDVVVAAIAGVVVRDDGREGGLLLLGLHGVVRLLRGEVLLDLADVGVPVGRGREDAGHVEGLEAGLRREALSLDGLEELVVFDGVVDGLAGEEGVELPLGRRAVVLVEDGLHDLALGHGIARFGHRLARGLVVVNLEAEDVAVVDRVRDRVGVELFFEDVGGGQHGGLLALDLLVGRVLLEDGCAREAEELGLREEGLDGPVVVPELRAVAFVEDEDHALVAQGRKASGVVLLARLVEGEAELLDRGDDDLVRVVPGEEAPHEGLGVGVLLDAALLEAVELLAGLAVQVLAVHDEEALLDLGVVLEEGGSLEGGEGLARARSVPDVAVAAVLVDAVHDGAHRVDLVGPHHEELALACHEDHVAAEHLPQGALGEEGLGEAVELPDLPVFLVCELVEGEEALVRVEGEVLGVVVGEVPGVGPVGDHEELHEAEEAVEVTVAGFLLVVDYLLHRHAGRDREALELDLDHGEAVDEDDDVIALVRILGVDAELVHHLVAVLAPVLEVDEGVEEVGAVVPRHAPVFAQDLGGGEDVGVDDLGEEAVKLGIGETDAVELLEFGAEVPLEGGAVPDVLAIAVLELAEFLYEVAFDLGFLGHVSASLFGIVLSHAPRAWNRAILQCRRLYHGFPRALCGKSCEPVFPMAGPGGVSPEIVTVCTGPWEGDPNLP